MVTYSFLERKKETDGCSSEKKDIVSQQIWNFSDILIEVMHEGLNLR